MRGHVHYFLYYFRNFTVCTDIEELIGHTDTKIISDNNLAVLVRQMAVHANVSYEEKSYAHVYTTLIQAPDFEIIISSSSSNFKFYLVSAGFYYSPKAEK